jgi:hypothetical protein
MKRSDIKNFIRQINSLQYLNENEEEFQMAAASAAIAGKKDFLYKGKKYEVTMTPERASELIQKKKEEE